MLRSLFGPGTDCPAIEELARVMTGPADDPARNQMIVHMETCIYCRSELELYRIFQANDMGPDEAAAVSEITATMRARSPEIFRRGSPPAVAADPWWRNIFSARWFTPAALTAAGVLVALAIGLQLRQGAPPSLRAVNEGDRSVMRSTAVAVIAPNGDLRAAPTRMEWRAVPGAAKYRVRLLEVDGNELWSAEAAGTYLDLPAAVQARMVPGKSLLMQVIAFSGAGGRMAESELVRFRVLRNVYKP